MRFAQSVGRGSKAPESQKTLLPGESHYGQARVIERKALDDIRRDLDRMVPSWRLIYHDDIQAAAEDCGLWPEDADWDDADEFLAPLDLGEDAAWQRMEDEDDASA